MTQFDSIQKMVVKCKDCEPVEFEVDSMTAAGNGDQMTLGKGGRIVGMLNNWQWFFIFDENGKAPAIYAKTE